MIKYRFDRSIEVLVFFLFLINNILGTILLTLYYLKKFELSETKFIILFIYFIITIFALGELLLKKWHNDDKNKKT
jgi:membrane-anchored protein YejM (alkaline phosphatase superfamily)